MLHFDVVMTSREVLFIPVVRAFISLSCVKNNLREFIPQALLASNDRAVSHREVGSNRLSSATSRTTLLMIIGLFMKSMTLYMLVLSV